MTKQNLSWKWLKIFWDFQIQIDRLIPARRLDVIKRKKKRTCRIVDNDVLANHSGKHRKGSTYTLPENNLRKMQVMFRAIVIGALGTFRKNFITELEELEIEAIQTTTLLESAIILRRIQRLDETCYHSNSGEKTSTCAGVKNIQKSKIIIQVTIILIVIGAFGRLTKGLQKGLEVLEVDGQVETIQTTALLRTARIPRRVMKTWGDLLSRKLQWKTISVRIVVVIAVGNERGDTSSNPWRDRLHFTLH